MSRILSSSPSILSPDFKPPQAIAPPTAPPVPEVNQRDLGDASAARKAIFDRVLHAAQSVQPLANQRHTLRLSQVAYTDPGEYSYKQQKEAILAGRTLGRRMAGKWELVDNESGNVLDTRTTALARVPYLTDRGTFIHNGNEYTLSNQMRLRSGIFTRVKDNGEIEAHANILPGKGVSHRYYLDPEKGAFYMRLGQAKIPLAPLLKSLGANDKELRDAWGNDLWNTNAQSDDPGAVNKLYQRLVRKMDPDADTATKQKSIKDIIDMMELDPDVTRQTLGTAFDRLGKDSILATTKKLLAVSRGEQEVDDRDHLAFQTVMGPEDLFAERVSKDYGGLRRNLLFRSSFRGDLGPIQPGALTKQIEAALLSSGIGQAIEEINPGEIFDKQGKISRLGEGGIPSVDSVPDEARSVQPSHFGFIDPVRTPECVDDQTEVMTRDGWKLFSEVSADDEFASLVDGRLEYHKPIALIDEPYQGPMICGTSNIDFALTPNHRMYVKHTGGQYRGRWVMMPLGAVDDSRVVHITSGGFLPYLGRPLPDDVMESIAPGRTVLSDDELSAVGSLVAILLLFGECAPHGALMHININCLKRNDTTIAALERAADDLGLTLQQPNKKKPLHYTMPIAQAAALVDRLQIGDDAVIPEYILDAPLATRLAFYETFYDITNQRAFESFGSLYMTVAATITDSLSQLLFSLGRTSTITGWSDRNVKLVLIHRKDVHQLYSTKGRSSRKVIQYDGRVYCAQLPGGFIYIRRSGKYGFWTGNSFRVGVDANLTNKVRKGDDGRIYAKFNDLKTGKEVWRSPQDLANLTVAFPKELDKQSKRIVAMQNGKLKFVDRSKVDLVLPHFENAFSHLGNMVPMKSAVKAQRMAMASRMMTQALPVTDPEAPHVQSGMPDEDGSFEKKYGRQMGAIVADKPGRVISADNESIRVKYDDGSEETKQIYHNFPFSRKTFLHNTTLVQPGQRVEAGAVLAKSNYTDAGGTTALGKNLRTAYIPFRGLNFEDAVVISQSAAKKLSSEHMYQHGIDWEDSYKQGKKSYMALFGNKYNRETLDKLDDDGVIKEGTIVGHGDPLILAAQRRARVHGKIHKKREEAFSDRTEEWAHHAPGVVTDVFKGPKGTTVLVKSIVESMVGDKLCFDPETSMLTRAGWKPVADIDTDDEIATLNPTTDELEWQRPTHLHKYAHTGEMYYLNTKHINMLVTMDHRLWVARPDKPYQEVTAREFYASRGEWKFKKDCRWVGKDRDWMEFEPYVARTRRELHHARLPMDLWVELLGYYIAEGWCSQEPSGQRMVKIGQYRGSPHWDAINDCIAQLGLGYTYDEVAGRFCIRSKWLFGVLQELGNSLTKYVPEYIQELCPRQLLIFMDAYMAGDGHKGACWEFGSSSYKLAEDLQLVCLKLGWCVSLRQVDRTDNWQKSPHWRGRINRNHLRPWWKKSRVDSYESVVEEITDYSGDVYCVTVPNHIVYVKREEKSYWSLNSGRYG